MSVEGNFFGAAPAAESAATPAPAAQAPATSAPPVAPDTSSESDLASALRQEMMGRFGDPSARAADNSLPAGLVDGQSQVAAADPDANAQISAISGEEQKQPEDGKPEEGAEGQPQAAREDGRDEITAIHLEKFGRDFSLAEVEAAIEGFNYYHPKALKFQEDLQRFQAEVQQFEQLKSSPEIQLANMLKADPSLKQRFLQVAREHRPDTIQAHEENQQVTALKAEIEQLKGLVNQTQQSEQRRQEQAKQQAWQRHVLDTTRAVDQATEAKLSGLKQQGVEISEQEVEMVCQNAVAMVQAGRLKYEPQAMIGYFNQMFDLIANKALAARQQGIQKYQQAKQTLPPPPPSGGAAPVIAPDSPKNFGEMQDVLANRLEAVLNQM